MPTRTFLDWSEPLLKIGVKKLQGGQYAESEILILVPTRNSGALLKEEILAQNEGRAVFLPEVLPLGGLLERVIEEETHLSTPWMTLMSYTQALKNAPAHLLAQLFKNDLSSGSSSFARPEAFLKSLNTAQTLLRVKSLLEEEGYSLSDFYEHLKSSEKAQEILPTQEQERWEAFCALDQSACAFLAHHHFQDKGQAQLNGIQTSTYLTKFQKIILLGHPEPSPLTIAYLEAAERQGTAIEVWIHAPVEFADYFDDWGRANKQWVQEAITIPESYKTIISSENADSLAEQVVRYFSEVGAKPEEAAMTVCDPEYAPYLQDHLLPYGWEAYRAEGSGVSQTGFLKMILAMIEVIETPESYDHLLTFGGNYLVTQAVGITNPYKLMEALREVKVNHLPETIEFGIKKLEAYLYEDESGRAQADAMALSSWIQDWTLESLPEKARSLGSSLTVTNPETYELLRLWEEAIEEWEDVAKTGIFQNASEGLHFLHLIFSSKKLYTDTDTGDVRLQGWMESLYAIEPHHAIIALHEGIIPKQTFADSFLPDSLKNHLGFRDQKSMDARDSFILTQLLAQQSQSGKSFRIFISRQNAQDEPNLPSPLLLREKPDLLPARVLQLFKESDEESSSPERNRQEWTILLPNKPNPWKDKNKPFSPSLLKTFLACPKRFWLKNVLQFQEIPETDSLSAADIGNLCHDTLQHIMNRREYSRWMQEEALAQDLQKELERRYKNKYMNPEESNLSLRAQFDFLNIRLWSTAKKLSTLFQEGWEVLATEYPIQKWEIFPGYYLNMRIDCILYHRESNQYTLIDFKTSKHAKAPEKAHWVNSSKDLYEAEQAYQVETTYTYIRSEKNQTYFYKRWTDLQLPLYRQWLVHASPWKGTISASDVTAAYFNIPMSDKETGLSDWTKLNEDPTVLDSALQCAKFIMKQIREADFDSLPTAEELGWSLRYDSFAHLVQDGWAPITLQP